MINVNYQPLHMEIVQATLDFFVNRPMMRMLLRFMKAACLLLCIVFAIFLYTGNPQPKDYIFVAASIIWLFYYKRINRELIGMILKRRNLQGIPHNFNIDKQRIFCRDQQTQIEWKRVKFVLKNAHGYIVPLTGFANAGKFLWLPKRGFANEQDEQGFVSILHSLSKKLKAI